MNMSKWQRFDQSPNGPPEKAKTVSFMVTVPVKKWWKSFIKLLRGK